MNDPKISDRSISHQDLREKLENELKRPPSSKVPSENQSVGRSSKQSRKSTSGIGAYGNSPDKKLEAERQKIRKSIAESTVGKMREFRKSMKVDQNISNKLRESVSNSMARASVSFKTTRGGADSGELVIENERLKSTLLILNQKLKTNADTDGVIQRLKDQVDLHSAEINNLKTENL